VVAGVVYDADAAPLMLALFFCHWYVSGAVPLAVTLNVAVWPAATVLLAGCDVIAGATGLDVFQQSRIGDAVAAAPEWLNPYMSSIVRSTVK
jgi:hypothetical protein